MAMKPGVPLPRPTLAQLDALRTVIATSGVTEAARAMGISQPAVSKLLRQAERGLGLSLMVRDGNRVTPTLEADAIRDGLQVLFGAYDGLQRLAASLREDEAGIVAIAAIPTQAARFAAPSICRFKAESPATVIRLQILSNRAIIEQVASGQADVGLVHSITAAPELRVDDYGEQAVMCIAPRGHRFARLRAVSGADLLGETYVSYGRHSAFNRWLEDAFAQAGIALRTTIEVSASPALIEIVRLGAGVGLIESAALTAAAARTLVVRPFAPELTLRSRVLRRPGRLLSRHAERFLEIYRDIASLPHPLHPRPPHA
jgi:DNA-binding transcriptional LysR family regulator